MHQLNYYQVMADYNRWMNRKLYAICADIPDQTRKADRGAFFKSIHGTLNHLLYGDRAWIGRFTDQPFRVTNMGQDMYAEFAELQQAREVMDQQIIEWAQTLSEDWLSQPFNYTSNIDGKTRILPAWVLVTHMFNHQTHHRGQLTTLLCQLGYDPGITDLPWLPSLTV
ncbi:MAG: DinB family protein [Elainellaceae cyanobacterium]